MVDVKHQPILEDSLSNFHHYRDAAKEERHFAFFSEIYPQIKRPEYSRAANSCTYSCLQPAAPLLNCPGTIPYDQCISEYRAQEAVCYPCYQRKDPQACKSCFDLDQKAAARNPPGARFCARWDNFRLFDSVPQGVNTEEFQLEIPSESGHLKLRHTGSNIQDDPEVRETHWIETLTIPTG
jgi:hypothetical protein